MRFIMLAMPALGGLALIATAAIGQPSLSPQVAEGQRLYAENCAMCHGEDGRRGAGFQTPIWGEQTQITKFSTALGLFEYNQMMMPFDDPDRLNDEQKWAITAYMLANHGAIPRDGTLDQRSAASVPIR
ncbi:c-type cytochrome [Roseococcus microcysteis]|uniref:c-type cytochrome n=1 Tax=Roseococcus microcysteis TaxID=2771361 RepID=UPI00168BAF45|nr:cytochrome c [Roseococcus microcysteis]